MVVALAVPVVVLPIALLLSAVALRLIGKVAAGVVSRWSPAAIRIWLKTGAVAGASQWLSGTLFWPSGCGWPGCASGRRRGEHHHRRACRRRSSIGDESFFADGIYLCQRPRTIAARSR